MNKERAAYVISRYGVALALILLVISILSYLRGQASLLIILYRRDDCGAFEFNMGEL